MVATDAIIEVGGCLRPSGFDSFTGQELVVDDLKIAISAARSRGEVLGHVLFYGGPGLGKTTLAHLLSVYTGQRLVRAMGPSLQSPAELAAVLAKLRAGDILFVDEIHRCPPPAQEVLYPALEDCELRVVTGQGAAAETINIPLAPFTLVGATTRRGLLTEPLLDRFQHAYPLQPYSPHDLARIIENYEPALGCVLTPAARLELAGYAKATARIAITLLSKLRDYCAVFGTDVADEKHVAQTMQRYGLNKQGLDHTDVAILKALATAEKPLGLNTLAGRTGEDKDTIEASHEPWLLRSGLVDKTPQGRKLTPAGYSYLGLQGRAV